MLDKNPNQVRLPTTNFPLMHNPEFDKQLQKLWLDLEDKCDAVRKDSSQYVLHDGPPYANGPLHMGHALNKIHKDFANRTAHQRGMRVLYVPGWDCHGLPIETAVQKKQDTRNMSITEKRAACREFAAYWLDQQSRSFREYGVRGRFDRPYSTMDHSSEITILKNFHDLVRKGLVYRALRPVWWSYSEQTSLAEAELEYKELESTAIDVEFKVCSGQFKGYTVPIWTTTPWTMYANEAVAYSVEVEYVSAPYKDTRILIARNLAERFFARIGQPLPEITSVDRNQLTGVTLLNPADKKVPLLVADFVTDKDGTGFVHIAPAHGLDDFALGKKHNLPVTYAITETGELIYPKLSHLHFTDSADAVCETLGPRVIHKEKFKHQYPVSWRSKKPLVYRATHQWFIDVESVRQNALEAIEKVEWIPHGSKARITSMVANRPDWCISRQRTWGIPLAFFFEPDSGKIRTDLIDKTLQFLDKHGLDAWFNDPRQILDQQDQHLVPAMDILDIWVEAGLTNRIITQTHPSVTLPVDMVIEGSDQHRGWFQASLVLSCADSSTPPYKKVLTHGFVVDKHGDKMSKSLGNVTDPLSIVEKYGADTLRLMILNATPYEDLRLSTQVLTSAQTQLKRFRLTLRYMLGIINHKAQGEVDYLPLEKWVLSRLASVDAEWRRLVDAHQTGCAIKMLYKFCDEELSGLYLDVRKDALYCDSPDDPKYRSYAKCIEQVFQHLVRWLSPAAPFLTEEAWQHHPHTSGSVHVLDAMPIGRIDTELELRYSSALQLRSIVYKHVEQLRCDKILNTSHAARVVVGRDLACKLSEEEMRELCIVSEFKYSDTSATGIQVEQASGARCPRCRFYSEFSGGYCTRCTEALSSN